MDVRWSRAIIRNLENKEILKTPERSGSPKVEGTNELVQHLRSSGPHQPVILVVDDDAQIRNLVTQFLQQDGYFVLTAADGHDALELSRNYPGSIDLVITDMQMPRLIGSDLCAHLMEERPGIMVLMMSGADTSVIVNGDADMPFLSKPFDGRTLKASVCALVATPVQPNDPFTG